jgi:hypothetical protein
MEDKLVNELATELTVLRKANADMKAELDKTKAVEMSYTFQVCGVDSGKPMIIRGVLIGEGIWRGVKYSYEFLKSIKDRFVGIPYRIEHGRTEKYKDSDNGELTKVKANDVLRCLEFEAEVVTEDAKQDIIDKRIDAVSISGLVKIDNINGQPTAVDYNPIEFSGTSTPVCPFCNIFNYELSAFNEKPLSTEQSNTTTIEEGMNFMSTQSDNQNPKPAETPAEKPQDNQTPSPAAKPAEEPKANVPSVNVTNVTVDNKEVLETLKAIQELLKKPETPTPPTPPQAPPVTPEPKPEPMLVKSTPSNAADLILGLKPRDLATKKEK